MATIGKGVLASLVLGVIAAAGTAHAQGAKNATDATKAAKAAVLQSLPFSDRQSFGDARRGFIAPLPDGGVIANAEGRAVWDMTVWDCLGEDAPAPETVNPSLWRQAQLHKISGLFQVTEEIYQVRGADLANITLIEGPEGIVVMDPLMNLETAQVALDLYFRHRPKRPIIAVIVTHSHIDHFGGTAAIEAAAADNLRIVAPDGFTEASVAENVLGGNLRCPRV